MKMGRSRWVFYQHNDVTDDDTWAKLCHQRIYMGMNVNFLEKDLS